MRSKSRLSVIAAAIVIVVYMVGCGSVQKPAGVTA
jgi:hypothetical protein